MSPPPSTQDKSQAWRALPRLLLLLLPGSWALPKAQELQSIAGQTLSVKCQYPPTGRFYEKKGWCREKSEFVCTKLVISSKPRTLAQVSRFSIWDNPDAGFFIVTMSSLREEDSGHYWCKSYRASGYSVSRSIRFYLAVSPASASTQATRAPPDLVSSQTQSSVPPTREARDALKASPAITAPPHLSSLPSRPRNSTLHHGPAAPSALLPVLCGLLVAKTLLLLLLLW
ncbi:natural cytotoxicity triggering receptor 2 isoform X2 [Nycticebus coucang]|uniref:natural cytotoxicity triggering receptor 2 isoform X2 n=1 Tax=Nycticebus coucang TaxID=9470 RepID=UPI00234D8A94|nr:natural cytotoxicity triggering receptor 2 isoform X2 [Nycticebus coucang]